MLLQPVFIGVTTGTFKFRRKTLFFGRLIFKMVYVQRQNRDSNLQNERESLVHSVRMRFPMSDRIFETVCTCVYTHFYTNTKQYSYFRYSSSIPILIRRSRYTPGNVMMVKL